jgi:hypothetical protein
MKGKVLNQGISAETKLFVRFSGNSVIFQNILINAKESQKYVRAEVKVLCSI